MSCKVDDACSRILPCVHKLYICSISVGSANCKPEIFKGENDRKYVQVFLLLLFSKQCRVAVAYVENCVLSDGRVYVGVVKYYFN